MQKVVKSTNFTYLQ